ncbi:exp1-like protein [Podila epigama]|nr:exp1-like protein [Podila epigama]
MASMINLAAFRSVLTVSSSPMQMRTLATKAAAASTVKKAATTKAKQTKAKESKAKAGAKETKGAKGAKKPAEKPKKEDSKAKAIKIQPVALPKRPNSGWTNFYVEHLNKVRASGQPVVLSDEAPKAGAAWRALSDRERNVYVDRYKAEMVEYRKKSEARLQELTPAEFKLENTRRAALRATGKSNIGPLKDPNAPKRPLSAYFLYAQDQRNAGKHANLSPQERIKAFAADWAASPESVKAKYNAESAAARESYKAVRSAYYAEN